MEPKISVIVPVYNGQNYLENCIKSITASVYKNLEILLVNDGSTDSSLTLCRKLAEEDGRIKVLNQCNKGVSAARNYGIREATGEFISFVDCDDRIQKDMYSILIANMKPDIDFIQFGFVREREDGKIISRYQVKNKCCTESQNLLAEYLFPRNPAGVWSKFYRTEVIKQQEHIWVQFNEKIPVWEDLLFNCTYIKQCRGKALFLNAECYVYRLCPNSVSRSPFSEKQLSVMKTFEMIFSLCEGNAKALNHAELAYCEILGKTLRKAYAEGKSSHKREIMELNSKFYELSKRYMKSNLPDFKMKLFILGMRIFPKLVSKI